MKVEELRKEYGLCFNYNSDWNLVNKYSDAEVECYAVCMNSSAFIFKGSRKYFAFIDGMRASVSKTIMLIQEAKISRVNPTKELINYSVMEAL